MSSHSHGMHGTGNATANAGANADVVSSRSDNVSAVATKGTASTNQDHELV